MPRRPALVTQADVARAIRAAKQEGAARVEIRSDGTIVICVAEHRAGDKADNQIDERREIRL